MTEPLDAPRRSRRGRWAIGAAALVVAAAAVTGYLVVNRDAAADGIDGELATPTKTPFSADGGCSPKSYRLHTYSSSAFVTGVSPNGEYLVGTVPTQGEPASKFVLWHNGKSTTVKAPGPSRIVGDPSVNDSGVVAASGGTDTGAHAWRYADGKFTTLKVPGANKYSPGPSHVFIANDGTVAGTVEGGSGSLPLRWESGATTATKLRLPHGKSSGEVAGISADGVILGKVTAGKQKGPWIWGADGKGRRLLAKASVKADALSIAGDWVLISDNKDYRLKRVNFREGQESDGPRFAHIPDTDVASIDSRGMIYALKDSGDFVAYDHRFHRLPGPPAPTNGDPSTGNYFNAASQDGTAVVGFTGQDGKLVVLSCD